MKPRLLDLFCGAGGCSTGYYRAWFDVVGVDINPQPNYPFEFVQGDALEWSIPIETQKQAMGVDWNITVRELSEAIPPAYTQFIGEQLLSYIEEREAA